MNEAVYLDNAATTFPKPEEVYSYADKAYREFGANANRGGSPLARKASELIDSTRYSVATWFSVKKEQIIFSPSATLSLNQVILGSRLTPGATIYVTPFEHNSVLRPLERLRDQLDIRKKILKVDKESYEFKLTEIETQFKAAIPEMVILNHASNVLGLITPVRKIASMVKEINPNAVIIVDGAQLSCMDGLKIDDGLIDYYIFSAHKALYGPYGAAGFVLGSDNRPDPVIFGGTGTQSETLTMPSITPDAYEPGSPNLWSLAGLNAALSWIEEVGKENILSKQEKLKSYLIEGLESLDNAVVYKPLGEMTSVVSFNVKDLPPQTVENYLGSQGISVRAGLHCAPWAHDHLGTLEIGGTVRVSPGYFNTEQQIEFFLDLISQLQ